MNQEYFEKEYTDKDLIDFLESKNKENSYTGKCVFRMSDSGRGWRLHETSRLDAKESVREAIIDAIEREDE
jgi:hypothetical protein